MAVRTLDPPPTKTLGRKRSRFERVYFVGVVLKGIDGVGEFLLGLLLSVAPSLVHTALSAGASEARESADPFRVWLGDYLTKTDLDLASTGTLLIVAFLMVHGAVKIATAYCLVRRILRAYPWAIGVLAALFAYQAYIVVAGPSVTGVVFAVIDVLIIGLVVREYQMLRVQKRADDRATEQQPFSVS